MGKYDNDEVWARLIAAGFLFLVGCVCLALQHYFFPSPPTAHVEVQSNPKESP